MEDAAEKFYHDLKFIGKPQGFIKNGRLVIDGVRQVYRCKTCGEVHEHDFKDEAWRPVLWAINQPMYFSLYCRDCDKIWSEKVRLNVSLEVLND